MPRPVRKLAPLPPPAKPRTRLRAIQGGAAGAQALKRQRQHEQMLQGDVETIQGVEIKNVKRRIGI